MKKYILLVVVLIIAGGVYLFMASFESIVERLVHKYGSEVTQTSVDISGLKVKLSDGKASINHITVANPKGYKTPYIFVLDGITVQINLKSLTTDTIIIESVDVLKPVVTYEMTALNKNNIDDILNNVNSYTARKAKETPKPDAKKEDEPSKKVIIKKLVISQGELDAVANLNVADLKVPLANNKASVKLPQIVLTDIGQSKGGNDIGETISQVITQMLATASQTVMTADFGDMQSLVQGNIKSATDTVNAGAKAAISGVTDTASDVGSKLKDTVNMFK